MKLLAFCLIALGLLTGCSLFTNDTSQNTDQKSADEEVEKTTDTSQSEDNQKLEHEEQNQDQDQETQKDDGNQSSQTNEEETLENQEKVEIVENQEETPVNQSEESSAEPEAVSNTKESDQNNEEETSQDIKDYYGYWMNFDGVSSDYGSGGIQITDSTITSFVANHPSDEAIINDTQVTDEGIQFSVTGPEGSNHQVTYSVEKFADDRDILTTIYGHTFYRVSQEEFDSLDINL